MVAVAATAGLLAPYNPLENDYAAMLSAPLPSQGIDSDHDLMFP